MRNAVVIISLLGGLIGLSIAFGAAAGIGITCLVVYHTVS